ncbi:LysR family transcriptional regulator [Ramlibacter terrae]|uniref:LysR family transcriptional regulator n=1 Tax=Ramlibacter terrae TaxID=2732511 RepID=A0ABX6NZM5_9BURK|nr:LysR family transcriptional regulator [Ramlibacter terrae]
MQLATIPAQGSISKASQHLHLTQPTLTHNMQVLEMQVGGKLFDRSRFGVRSTPLGEMLAREGRAIVRRLEDAREISARHRTGLRGTVRLGAGPLIGAALLPRITQALLQRLPDIHLSVQSDRPHLLVDQLVDGRHDLVIAPSWLDQPPSGFERFLLVRDDLGVFCGTSHPLAAEGVLAPGASHAHKWISLGTSSPFDKAVRDMLEEAGVGTPRTEITIWAKRSRCCRCWRRACTSRCCHATRCACCSGTSRSPSWRCPCPRRHATSTCGARPRCWTTRCSGRSARTCWRARRARWTVRRPRSASPPRSGTRSRPAPAGARRSARTGCARRNGRPRHPACTARRRRSSASGPPPAARSSAAAG